MGTLRFILGRAGSGKTTRIVREIAALLHEDPLGDPILLLVPDQATLLYERLLACAPGSSGYLRVSVITFRDLIERLLCEGGGSSIPEVTPLGRRILIGRLLRRMQPQLSFYRSTARQPGLASKLDEAFAEIERSGRNLEDLLFIAGDIEAQNPRSSLPAKLRDLHLLIREYESVLGTERLDQHRRFAQALTAATRSAPLPRTRVYVDDFYDFTSTERAMLIQLARHGLETTVALAVSPGQIASLMGNDPIDDEQLLRSSSLAFRRLHRNASESQLPIEQVVLNTAPRFESPELLHIDRQFDAARPGKLESAGDVLFVEASTRRDEVDAAARQIQQWVGQGMRLRDVVVLARDIAVYEHDVEASFREHGLPCFIDRQRPASHHPLIRSVRALLQLVLHEFRHDVVLDLIRAGLSGIDTETGNALENYLLAHRVRGTLAWAEPWAFTSRRKDADEPDAAQQEQIATINSARQRIYAGVLPLLADDASRPAGDWCGKLCSAMNALQIQRALAEAIAAREQTGELEHAASDRAVWTEFTELLDQLCSVLADEQLPLREFAEVLDVALERFTLAITPPTIDQVLVGSVDRTRTANVKACLVLGLSEGTFPSRSDDAAALNDDDRRHLDARQFELRSDTRGALLDEQTFAYLAFTRPANRLVVMRNTVDADGRALAASVFWSQLQHLFKSPTVRSLAARSDIDTIATPAQLAASIVKWSQSQTAAPAAEHIALTSWFLTSAEPRTARAREIVKRAMAYRNDAALSRAVSLKLFPEPVKMSATRLETFAACPFKHFAQYTLGLRVRDEADLTPLDMGTVYHQVLENLFHDAIRARVDFAEPIPGLSEQIRSQSELAASELRSDFMLTPGRNRYLIEGVRSTVEHIVETQRHAIAAGEFRPRQTEFAFGLDPRVPPLTLTTPQGRWVQLRGKIDRIDIWPMGTGVAASVVDYKLGDHKADFSRIANGLSLQLVTYLLVLEAMGESLIGAPVTPAAAFYVRLLRQIESIDHPGDRPDPSEPATYLKRYKPRGVIDERFVASLDRASQLSLKPLKNPEELKKGDVLGVDAFAALLRWTRNKLAQLSDEIIDGRVEVRPYRLKTQTPCSTCDYRPVCRLDLAFNRYLPITDTSADSLAKVVTEAK